MAQLQVHSERFTVQFEFAFSEAAGSPIPFALIVDGKGEASESPPALSLEAGLLGTVEARERTVGDTEYRYDMKAGEVDGGRPWVRRRRVPSSSGLGASGLDPGGILESDVAGKQGTFSKLVEVLGAAVSIVEAGPVTVEDQRVIEFDASLNPAPLIAQLEAKAKKPKHPLQSLFPVPPVGAQKVPRPHFPAPTLELEVFIAPNGLPVRERATFSAEGVTIAVRTDTLAVNIPVSVSAPPARRTIDEGPLKKLERRRAARELKEALRFCNDLTGKSASECRAAARAGSIEAAAPESSLL